MIGYVEAPGAWGFTREMARSVGVDLAGAVVEGWLTRAELGALVQTCACCGQTSGCRDWLADGQRDLPGFCGNGAALAALKP